MRLEQVQRKQTEKNEKTQFIINKILKIFNDEIEKKIN
jgi:hypothetical protein